MNDVAPPGFSARRRGGSLAFRLELTTTDRALAEAISAAAGDHGQTVPAYVLGAAHALATGSDGPSVAVARCLPTDALRVALKERERTSCATCARDLVDQCAVFLDDGHADYAAVRVWCDENFSNGMKPGATGCPGWRAKS